MKFLDLLRLSTGSLFKRKVRTILTILGVMIGVSSIMIMVSLGLGLSRAYMANMESYGSLTSVTVRDASEGGYYYGGDDDEDESLLDENKHLNDEALEELAQIENVTEVIPCIEVSALVKSGVYESYLTLVGVPEGYLETQKITLESGTFPTKNNGQLQILYGNQVLPQFYNPKNDSGYWYDGTMADIDLMEDSMIFILDQDRYWEYSYGGSDEGGTPVPMPKKHLFETCGLIAGGVEDYNSYSYSAYCNIDDLKQVLQKEFKGRAIPGQPLTAKGKPYKEFFYSYVMVNAGSIDNVTEVQKAIKTLGYSAESEAEWIKQEQGSLRIIELVLGGIGAVALLVAAIGIANTMMMSIYERTKEIGIMKVLGCDMKNIQGMFLIEAGFIGFLGGVAGMVISYIISVVINIVAKSFVADMIGNASTGISYIPLWLAMLSLAFAVLVGMIAGFFPSLRAMRLSPLAAIRNE